MLALALAFLITGGLWWLYFGVVAEHSRRQMTEVGGPGRLARDAYTYLHLPIVAGVIMVAVGDDLLIAHPNQTLSAAGVVMLAGGPALFLAGEVLFRHSDDRLDRPPPGRCGWRARGRRPAAAQPLGAAPSRVAVSSLLGGLAAWEQRASDGSGGRARRRG